MPDSTLHVHPDPEALGRAAAGQIVQWLHEAPADRPLSLVLAGGSTPAPCYRHLATTFRDAVPWHRLYLFWGDERVVPPDDPASNFRMALHTLIQHVPIPPEHVHRMPTDGAPPTVAARAYEATLRAFFDAQSDDRFDVTLLGMGADGHTASLFPNDPILQEREAWVCPVEAPSYMTPTRRLTLTVPRLNRSRHVLFLVAGEAKRAPLRRILTEPPTDALPASRIQATDTLAWFVDAAARP